MTSTNNSVPCKICSRELGRVGYHYFNTITTIVIECINCRFGRYSYSKHRCFFNKTDDDLFGLLNREMFYFEDGLVLTNVYVENISFIYNISDNSLIRTDNISLINVEDLTYDEINNKIKKYLMFS